MSRYHEPPRGFAENLISTDDAAKDLDISPDEVWRTVWSARLPYVVVPSNGRGSARFVRLSDLLRALLREALEAAREAAAEASR